MTMWEETLEVGGKWKRMNFLGVALQSPPGWIKHIT